MSFLKLVKLAKQFEAKLKREGQPLRYVTGPGQSMMIDPSQVQLPPGKTQHELQLEQVPPPPPDQPAPPAPEPPRAQQKAAPAKPNANVKAVQDFLNQQIGAGTLAAAPINFPNGYWTQETVNALKNWAQQSKVRGNFNQVFNTALTMAKVPGALQQAQQATQETLKQLEPGPALQQARRM
jgi:hypothetical protein